MRFEGQVTDESLSAVQQAIRAYSAKTDAGAGISDYSSVTEFPVSSDLVRQLADDGPPAGDATRRPRVIVAPATVAFGLFRMFQIVGAPTRPLLRVVRTMDEALAVLGVQSPHFEPLE